jgi:anti-sigma B factor antagonist
MEYHLRNKKDKLVVTIEGDFDLYSAYALKKKILSKIEKTDIDLLIDCSNINYIDSSGIGLILHLFNHQKEKQKDFKLKNISEEIIILFKAIKLYKTISGCLITETIEEKESSEKPKDK